MQDYDEGRYKEMMNLRDKDAYYTAKQEVGESTKTGASTSSSSRQWSGFKNPRIVRVSRAFGGKDRHSKVCTIKGLRDRRIRLSVPTAIQLYDLQDRLGLNQPSKVIDWLLDTTKDEIDKLPPLPMIPGSFTPFHQPTHTSQGYEATQSSLNPFFDANLVPSRKEYININRQIIDHVNEENESLVAKLKYWDSNVVMRSKQKGIIDNLGGIGDSSANTSQVSAQNFFPIATPSTSLSNPMFNYYQWEPNLSLTQSGTLGLASQNDHQNPQTNSGSHLFLCPSMASTPLFPPQNLFMNSHHQEENELPHFNRFHVSNSLSSPLQNSSMGLGLKPFPFGMNHQPHLQQNDLEDHQDKR